MPKPPVDRGLIHGRLYLLRRSQASKQPETLPSHVLVAFAQRANDA